MPDAAPEPDQAPDLHARFQPDYTPEQLEGLGVYDALYRGAAPRLASLGEWKPEWLSEHDPKGWAQWYKRYASGRRIPGEDERQIKRWLRLKARHGGPFAAKPTARRGWALRNWAVDPAKLVPDQAQEINSMLEEHQRRAMQKFVQERVKQAGATWRTPANLVKIVGKPNFAFGAPRRLEYLQQAARKLNLGTVPGAAFNKFIGGLRWRPVPDKVMAAIDGVTNLQAPRYLFRGITPHSNIRTPFRDHGATQSFVHGSPQAEVASNYARSIGPAAGSDLKTFQVFKPTAQQNYTPDFQLDVTGGKGWDNSTWPDVVSDVQKKMQEPLAHPMAMPPKPITLVKHRAYETPITRDNKPLGTFLTRFVQQPGAENYTREFAKIPPSAKAKAEGLGREWNQFIQEGADVNPHRHVTSDSLTRVNANQARAEWGRPLLKKTDVVKTAALSPDNAPQLPTPAQPALAPRFSITRPGTGLPGVRNWFNNAARKATMAGTLAMGLGGVAAESIPQQRPAQDYHAATFSMLGEQQLHDQSKRQALLAQQAGAMNQEKASALAPGVELQEHQQRVSDRISGDDPRLLVYHGLGSGKSLSAIAAAEAAKKVHGGNYGVVVPASLRGNFQKELGKFAPGSNPELLSYSGLALGKKFQQQPDTLVMDEAQRLRNPESAASRAAREAAQKAKRLVLLSGTPITNSPSDMASLISMLTNKEITPKQFEERYVGYKSKFPGVIPWLRGAQWGEVPHVKNEQELRKLLEGRVDYQPSKTPEGVDVQEEVVKVPLSKAQQKIQKAIRTKIPPGFLWKMDQEFPLSREELAKMNSFMNGMRQVSLSTQSFRADHDPLRAFDQSSKLQAAMQNLQKSLESDERKKALVYSNFVESGVNPYAAALERAKIPYGVFHGGIPTDARQKALKDYNDGKLRALLIGPAGAEGISTKGTNLIQLLDPHWNEARIQQARGRGLRFDSHAGLPEDLKNVQVQRYLSTSEEPGFLGKLLGKRRQRTGDEVLESLAANKEQLNEAFRKILRDVGTPAPRTQPAE